MLEVFSIAALKDNYIYILRDHKNRKTAVIDPSESKPVFDFLKKRGWNLDAIWNTHHHWDHVGGNLELKESYQCPLVCSRYDETRIEGSDTFVDETTKLKFGEEEVQIIELPGHTLGHIAFVIPQSQLLFSGDTLFSLGCGRIFEGSPEQMFNSLQKLKELHPDTQVFCGHEYTLNNLEFCLSICPDLQSSLLNFKEEIQDKISKNQSSLPTTIKTELQLNPFLNAEDFEVFRERRARKDHF